MALGLPVAAGLSWRSASVPSTPLRSIFFAPCSFRLLKNSRHCHHHHSSWKCLSFRKCVAQISSPPGISSGIGVELHHSMVQLHVGIVQRAADLGFPVSAIDGALGWWAIAVPAMLWYLFAPPGTVSGLLDYAYAPMDSLSNVSYNAEDVEVGRQIGQGSFGIVHEGYIGRGKRKGSQKQELHVVLKKVKPRSKGAAEMHNAEVHMNRRVKRTAPNSCADFLGIAKVSSSQIRGRLSEGLWLIWRFEGDRTLDYFMKQKNFPENLAEAVLGHNIAGATKHEIVEKSNAVIRTIAAQVLTCLRDLHKTGLVHRDVKPLNLILAEDSGSFKLVDLGAAVDLRSGFNYVPDETIIDPTYAAPERHVMPTSTPALPSDPLCSLVSPLVWLLNTPDRFDLFSAGLILLQMAVKPLRHDVGLQSFNAEFKRASYDLDTWRRKCRLGDEEFALLDTDGAAGWELLRSMLQPRHDKAFFIWPSLGHSRPSADAALKHRFFTGSSVKFPTFNALELPAFSLALEPGNMIPSFSYRALSKLGASGPGLEVDSAQLVSTIGAVVPIVTTSAITLAVGGLVFSVLRDSAQKSYAVGQKAMEFLGIGGSLLIVSFLVIRSLLEAQKKKGSSGNSLSQLKNDEWAAVDIGTFREAGKIDYGVQTIRLQHLRKRPITSSHLVEDAAEDTRDHKFNSKYVPKVGSQIKDSTARIRELLSSRPQHSTQNHINTGLAEAVLTMELQLASLESSIATGRQFAQQQQQSIIQIQKLLKHRHEAVSTGKQSKK